MPEYSFDEMARYVRGRDRFDADIRMDAIQVFADLGDPRVRSELEAVARDPQELDEVREAAIHALSRRRPADQSEAQGEWL
jgi:HEAT repeat protein